MAIDEDKLKDLVARLATKREGKTARHVNVTNSLHKLLVDELDVDPDRIDFESPLKMVRGSIDALLGLTIFEFKSNLDTELRAAEIQLLKYLRDKDETTGKEHIGIATDGALFRVYNRKKLGEAETDDELEYVEEYKTNIKKPSELLIWLENTLVLTVGVSPDVANITAGLGRKSAFYERTQKKIDYLWQDLRDDSEVATKYAIWKRLLNTAYGSEVDEVALFLQHTYLTIVAKSIATVALLGKLPSTGKDLLSGEEFKKASVSGAIESDFFDWILSHADGDELVMNIVQHVKRFRWQEVETDILKILYENLMDPSQRRDLGEYYTPDWLAEKMCREVITDPMEMRIIDPTCGSGTFLFHAIRLGLKYAEDNDIDSKEAVHKLTTNIVGIDVHPVAVIFARVVYLLALLPALRKFSVKNVSLPVYLGNSLQWDIREITNSAELEITVPPLEKIEVNKNGGNKKLQLRFPTEIVSDPFTFDEIMDVMLSSAESEKSASDFGAWLKAKGTSLEHAKRLVDIYSTLCDLQAEKRNHIWGYVARNQSRPAWLAGEGQKAHVVIGNPPWRSYRKMSADIQGEFKREMRRMQLWSSKATSTQDLACYCFVRCMELYMRQDGVIAFVMPYATTMNQPYKNFRECKFLDKKSSINHFQIFKAWAFSDKVKPLFPVPACVLFASNSHALGSLPKNITRFSGKLNRRDANITEAEKALESEETPWPLENKPRSLYAKKFHQGATLVPRRFCFIEPENDDLDLTQDSPLVEGKTGGLDKEPWKNVTPPKNNVESKFIYPVFKGESIAPYQTFSPLDAVIPWCERFQILLDSAEAMRNGHANLSNWLSEVEAKFRKHNKKITFTEQINGKGGLSNQFPIKPMRVVYATSGSQPAATIIKDERAAPVDTSLYWMATENMQEAYYLLAILNSETARAAIEDWQVVGQFGKRHFAKVMFNLEIPIFSDKQPLHVELANAAETAEKISAQISPLEKGERFEKTRKRIREALREDGIAKQIDDLVATLLKITQ